MYNYEHNGSTGSGELEDASMMSPRISFSNDFVEAQYSNGNVIKPDRGPVSSDFEFCVSGYSMMTADELFYKGRLLPLKYRAPAAGTSAAAAATVTGTTLRDELLVYHDNVGEGGGGGWFSSTKPPKGTSSTTRWKGLLGLRKSHIGSKKAPMERSAAALTAKRSSFSVESPKARRASSQVQEMMTTTATDDQGSSATMDMDMKTQ